MIRILMTAFILSCVATSLWAADAPAAAAQPPASAIQKPAKPFVYIPKPSDIVTGKENAPVVLVEYASLSCHHCAHFFQKVLPVITAKYIDTGKVKMVYRHYPLNAPALKAAELVQCAERDQQHAFIKVLFATQMKWAFDVNYRDALSNIAVLGGMDRLKFEACMNNKSLEKTVLSVAKEASEDYKVSSTPTFYINGVEYKGDREVPAMNRTIDTELAKVKTRK